MKEIKKIYIHDNGNEQSTEVAEKLKKRLLNAGFVLLDEFSDAADLLVCIGGDGTFLRMLRSYRFPKMSIVGINTGHLGFFQEFVPDDIDELINNLKTGSYSIQEHRLLDAEVKSEDCGITNYQAINDISIKGPRSTLTHLNLSFGDCFIEHFSGDGLLVSTPVGSTSYNYSLKGAIVDPRNDLMQITPIAPMNTKVFRSFTSSILVPKDEIINVKLIEDFSLSGVLVADGAEYAFKKIESIQIKASEDTIKLIRRKDYRFWETVKDKFF